MVAKLLLFLNCAIIACVHAYGDEYGFEGGEMDGMNPFSGSDPYGDGYGMGGYDGYGEDEEEPLYTLLDSVESIESFVAENMDYLVVIGIFDSDSNPNMEAYLNLVSEVRGPKYGRVSSRQILDDMNFETSSTVVLSYKPSRYFNSKYEQRRSRFPGKELTSVSLQRFVINSFPLVIPRIAEIDSLYESAKLPILYVYTNIDTQDGILSKHLTYLSNRLRQISLEYKGHLLISIADLSQYQYQFSSFGLTYDGSKKSQDVFLVITTVDTHYPMMTLSSHEFNSDNARDFIKNFMSGNLFGKRRIDLGDDVDVEFAPEVIEISDVDLARNILYPVEKFTFVEVVANIHVLIILLFLVLCAMVWSLQAI